MDDKAVITTLLTVNSSTEAEVIVGRLREAGIEAITEPHSDLAIRPAAGSLGTVDIRVPEQDAATARRVLDEPAEPNGRSIG